MVLLVWLERGPLIGTLEVEEDMTWMEENTRWLVLCSLVANRTWTVVPSPLVWSGGGTL